MICDQCRPQLQLDNRNKQAYWHIGSCNQLKPYPLLQVPKALAPFTQAAAALAKGDACFLHDPQLAASVFKFASQPLFGLPSQSPNLQREGNTAL
jgi:hypothetical protein